MSYGPRSSKAIRNARSLERMGTRMDVKTAFGSGPLTMRPHPHAGVTRIYIRAGEKFVRTRPIDHS